MTIFGLEEQMRKGRENGLGLMKANGQRTTGLKVNQMVDKVKTVFQLMILVILGRINTVMQCFTPYAH